MPGHTDGPGTATPRTTLRGVVVLLYDRQDLKAAFVPDEDEEEHGEDARAPDPQEQLWHGDELGLEHSEL